MLTRWIGGDLSLRANTYIALMGAVFLAVALVFAITIYAGRVALHGAERNLAILAMNQTQREIDAQLLTIDGVAVGAALGMPAHLQPPPAGSCLAVVITDAPIDHHGCERLARRVGLGLARTGSTAHHASGEIALALATGLRAPRGESSDVSPLHGRDFDPYFEAVVDATEEAVVSSLLAGRDVTGVGGRTVPALPINDVQRILEGHRA